MPITENTFTADELKAAITANPAINDLISGFILDDANKELPARQKLESGFIAPYTSRQAAQFEKMVEETTGIKKKDANEKYYDYVARALSETKGSLEPLKTELETLRKTGNPSEADKKRIQQLEGLLQEEKGKFTTQLQEKEARIHELTVGGEIRSGVAAVRGSYRKDLPASIVAIAENTVVADLLKSSKQQEDGTITFLDGKGDVIINKQTYAPETAENIVRERLKDLLDVQQQKTGTGTNEGSQGQQQYQKGEKGTFTGIPATVKTQVELTDHLLALGYVAGAKEYNEIWDKEASKLPLRNF